MRVSCYLGMSYNWLNDILFAVLEREGLGGYISIHVGRGGRGKAEVLGKWLPRQGEKIPGQMGKAKTRPSAIWHVY